METFRSLFTKPDPQAQVRKCNALLRQNIRRIDRDILNARAIETKTKNLILAADKRAQRLGPNHQQTKQAQREIRDFARELVKRRKETNRLHTFKAQLTSVQMQVNEAFALRKIEGSIKASVGIMKDVNTLIRLPELAGTMQELSVELMKAGIIEEMVGDALPETEVYEEEEEEAEEEVEKVLGEILKDRMDKTGALPSAPLPQKQKQQQQQVEEDEEEDTEAMMDQMRNRLEALRS
ncbi:Vacuolar protein-sorting-associated protein 24 [Podospora pseudocomata]|uniref:Vacuolar protein-sorting-associated protein 24 n=5 Tax=Podospora TaxID=5144 RepID=A0ABY6S826_PODCO|nr:Vacuolar protein-sorting-associated protein 24 [Podospora bellae-mahoneyi]KAK4656144.1 Vacuolar protein-sorting-associated protein 24 [Podospora pseudocomata]KAK4667379.1 Vacuolar protein-sorting-associated protein 24 [Podospora pseudopauciseta]KAK4678555.1 Vacuolar protein-sorting-associated protein 24 [Podospora pseudoanserina]VBB78020.1 Putative vacuolar protein-sorting-associated protein 24 [Podospora comata]